MVRVAGSKKFSDRIRKLLKSFKVIAFLGFFTIAIGTTLLMTQQQQDIRQEAFGGWGWLKDYYRRQGLLPSATPTPFYVITPTLNPQFPTATPVTQQTFKTPTPIPQSCTPNSYIGGTYCTGPTSCYDKYCDSTGTTTVNILYSGIQCSHCAPSPTPQPTTPQVVCSPYSYLGGTYCETTTRCYDIYCNSAGTGSTRTYYVGTDCSHCAGY